MLKCWERSQGLKVRSRNPHYLEILGNMNDLILLESVSARNEKLTQLTQDASLEHLNKAKSLVLAMWQGSGIATTQQMADYYEVSEDTVQSAIKNNRDEFVSDGLKVLKGKELKDVVSAIDTTSKTPSLTVWTPRAALRLGMLLRDSAIAKQVRTLLLDLAQVVPRQQEHIHELELRLALAQAERDAAIAQKNLLDTRKAVTEMGNQTVSALILGATVITDKTPIERVIDHNSGRTFEGVGITAIAQKLGYGKNTKACWQWLDSIGYGKDSGQWEEQIAAIFNHKLNPDAYEDILTKWNQGSRQRFIGE